MAQDYMTMNRKELEAENKKLAEQKDALRKKRRAIVEKQQEITVALRRLKK